MTRVSWREATDLFGHVDAKLISFKSDSTDDTAELSISYYPYWLHPQFHKQASAGNPFGAIDWDTARRIVTIIATGVQSISYLPSADVVDLTISDSHPALWAVEYPADLVSNAPLTVDRALQIADRARKRLNPGISLCEILDIERVWKHGASSSFSLGRYSRSILYALKATFEEEGHPIFLPWEPRNAPDALALVFDDSAIVATSIEVDVPEFDHDPAWYSPVA
jgi:hypothetical protein